MIAHGYITGNAQMMFGVFCPVRCSCVPLTTRYTSCRQMLFMFTVSI